MKENLAQGILQTGFIAVLVSCGVVCAYLIIFSQFAGYDDEGYLLMTVQHLVDGHRLYDEVKIPYGPLYYAYRWFVHVMLGIDLSNDSFRLNTLMFWLATTVIYSLTVQRLYRSYAFAPALAGVCFVWSLLHLRTLAHEPGHPQELVVILESLGLLAASFADQKTISKVILFLGLIAGGLLWTKANGGVFFLTALGLAVALNVPRGKLWWFFRYMVPLIAVCLPIVLLGANMSTGWAKRFLVTVTLGVLLSWGVGSRDYRGLQTSFRQLALLTTGFVIASGISIGFVLSHGSSLIGLLKCVLIGARRFGDTLGGSIPTSSSTLHWLLFGATLAFLYVFRRGRAERALENYVIPCLKLVLSITFFLQHWRIALLPGVDLYGSWPLHYSLGFLWMTLVVPGGPGPGSQGLFLRRLITFLAGLGVLQMYPVPGSQMWVGTVTMIPVMTLWLADALVSAQASLSIAATGASVKVASLSMGLAALLAILPVLVSWHERYTNETAVGFPGCRLTRMPERQAALYRSLVDTITAERDAFVCYGGLNSLYFWTRTRPAAPVVIGNTWKLLDPVENEQLLSLNRSRPRLLFIDSPEYFSRGSGEIPFLTYVQREMRPLVRLGEYRLFVRADRTAIDLRSCARGPRGDGIPDAVTQPLMQRLRLALPASRAPARITSLRLIDLSTENVLADTSAWKTGHKADLYDRLGIKMLPAAASLSQIDSAAELDQCDLDVPGNIDLNALGCPAVQLFSGHTRVLTLPVAVDISRDSRR